MIFSTFDFSLHKFEW